MTQGTVLQPFRPEVVVLPFLSQVNEPRVLGTDIKDSAGKDTVGQIDDTTIMGIVAILDPLMDGCSAEPEVDWRGVRGCPYCPSMTGTFVVIMTQLVPSPVMKTILNYLLNSSSQI